MPPSGRSPRALSRLLAMGAAIVFVAALVGATARAQSSSCPGCVLGLFDDEEMTRVVGIASGGSKTIYLGILYDGIPPAELTGIEFSISGLEPFYVAVEPYDDPVVVLGTPQAPAGVDTLYRQGGMNVAWAGCLQGNRVLARLELIPRTTWPPGTALQVRRRYPPSNESLPYPLVVGCDEPYYTARAVRGGRYFLDIPGVPACTVFGSTDFGRVPEGSSATLDFTLRNTGSGLLRGALSAACPDFALVGSDLSYALLRGESKQFTLRFSPTRAGENSCYVQGTGCNPILFTGRTTTVTPIATARSLLGVEVTVEAQVTVPANYSGTSGIGWVQDGSGRGIQVFGAGAANPILDDNGNVARVTGTVARSGSTLRLGPVRVVTLLSAGNPPFVPEVLSTRDAANPEWEGTFVQVTGGIASRRAAGAAMRYVVDDDSGPVTVVVSEALELPEFSVGDVVTARGVGGFDGEFLLHVGNPTDIFPAGSRACLGRRVIVGDAAGNLGQQVEVPIRIQWNPRPIDAFGLRVAFDGSALRFVGSRCCSLTADWHTCEARAVGRDTVVLGGFNPTPIPGNTTGDLMCLTFELLQCGGERRIQAFGVVDDLAGMGTCHGVLSCLECLSDGDVNEDGVLTPGDAQCAFEVFLEGQTLPVDCEAPGHCEIAAGDVNCDAVVTPGDAVEIFARWLGGNAAPGHCFARPAGTAAAFRLDARAAERLGGDLLAVPLEMQVLPGRAAFAVEVGFDPAAAEFVELRREPAGSEWPGLAARLVSPGRVLAGGFRPHAGDAAPQRAGTWVPLAQLVFREKRAPLALARVTWHERIADDHEPDAGPAAHPGLFLAAPYPNPLRGGAVNLPLFVPEGTQRPVHVSIHDVHGRLVRSLDAGRLRAGTHTLRWDGTDERGRRVAAGIYIVQARSGGPVLERKLAVVR